MSRVCELTGKGRQVGQQCFPRQQQDQADVSAEPAERDLDLRCAGPEREAARLDARPALGRACRRPRQLAAEDQRRQAVAEGPQAEARDRQEGRPQQAALKPSLRNFADVLRDFPERWLHFSFSVHRPESHISPSMAGFSPFPAASGTQCSLASRNEGGPARVTAPGPIFFAISRLEQLGELLDHRAAQLLRIHDRHRPAVIAGHVVADADRDQLDRRAALDPLDDLAQMALEIGAAIGRRGRIVDRRAVRKSPSGSAAPRAGRSAGCAPTAAPRRRYSP